MANEKKMDCVILGLLSHQSMTGYEIKKRLDTTLRFFWGASFGSIYPTLGGLVDDGLVTKLETNDNGRNKLIYTITEKGEEHLRDWLSIPVEKDEIRYETLLKLFFGSEVGPKETLGHIHRFEDKIRSDLPLLRESVKQLKKIRKTEKAHTYYMLTAMFGVGIYEAYLKWCDEVSIILKEEEDK